MRLEGYDIIRMINFIFVVRHPQHRHIFLANVAMYKLIYIPLIGFIQRAGDFIEQQNFGQKLQITNERDALLFTAGQFIDAFFEDRLGQLKARQIGEKCLFLSARW